MHLPESAAKDFSLVLVPGLRPENPQHWQALLAARWPGARSLPALGRSNLDLQARCDGIENAVRSSARPVLLVAHSGGCIAVAHWAQRTRLAIHGALLATPPLLERPLPDEFPDLAAFAAAGWLPLPQQALPFPCLVGASRNDPLGDYDGVARLARTWAAELVDLGAVGHLNPASGYGEWPLASSLLQRLARRDTTSRTGACA